MRRRHRRTDVRGQLMSFTGTAVAPEVFLAVALAAWAVAVALVCRLVLSTWRSSAVNRPSSHFDPARRDRSG